MVGRRFVPAPALLALVLCVGTAPGEEPAPARETVVLRVDQELPVSAFLDSVAKVLPRPLLYDPRNPRIAGQQMGARFDLTAEKSRFFDAVRAILAFYELTVAPVGPPGEELFLVGDARSTNSLVRAQTLFVAQADLERHADRQGVVVASSIRVKHLENLAMLRGAIALFLSPAGRVAEVPDGGSLLVADYAPNVALAARLVAECDAGPTGAEPRLECIELEHGSAVEIAEAIRTLLAPEAAGPRPPGPARAGPRDPRHLRPVAQRAPRLGDRRGDRAGPERRDGARPARAGEVTGERPAHAARASGRPSQALASRAQRFAQSRSRVGSRRTSPPRGKPRISTR
jgi:hypothetical protein